MSDDLTVAVGDDVIVVTPTDDEVVISGVIGPPGPGVPTGGTTGQVLAKASDADLDTEWITSAGGGGGGAVDSVNGQTGVVVLAAADVGADPAGSAAAAQAASQPLDADLTAIAALATTVYGRGFLALADAAAGRTALGLGTAATAATGDFDAAGAAAAAQAASQPVDSDLTAIAALTTTAFGRGLLTLADAAAGRTSFGLGGAAVLEVGTTLGTVAAGDDSRITGAAQKSANLSDLASAATARTNLGLVIGTDVQAYDGELAALAGLTSAADTLPYFTGAGLAALATFTAAGRALVDDADATAQRATLGLGSLATVTPTGTPDGTQFLRDDGSWAAAGGGVTFPLTNTAATGTTNQYATTVTADTFDRFTIDASGKQAWGSGSAATDVTLERSTSVGTLKIDGRLGIGKDPTYAILNTGATLTGQQYMASIACSDNLTFVNGASVFALAFSPTLTFNGTVTNAVGVSINPTIAGTTTSYTLQPLRIAPAVNASVTTARMITIGMSGTGTPTTTIGLDIGAAVPLAGSTKWGMQVGDYQSYHHGKLALGGTTAPTWGLHLEGTAQNRGAIGLAAQAGTPTSPASSSEGVVYVKGGKLVIAYNDAGTVRYKYLDLTGTGVTWVHTTTAP